MSEPLLSHEKSVLENVPDIQDVHSMRYLLELLGAKTEYKNHCLTISPAHKPKTDNLTDQAVCKMRASVLLLPSLIVHKGRAETAFPGGCILGQRSISSHLDIFQQFGCKIALSTDHIEVSTRALKAGDIYLSEQSVTATENALMLASSTTKTTTIYGAAIEPHVQDLSSMLYSMGVSIKGIGSHTLTVQGKRNLKGVKYKLTGDYLEAGTLAMAALIIKGSLTIEGIDPHQLDSVLIKLQEAGVYVERGKNNFSVSAPKTLHAVSQIKTSIHPGFPTDLQAPFAVLMTQAQGTTHIFETLFDGRLSYLYELEKMGARFDILNKHEAVIAGPTQLKGASIQSCDIRAGAAMVIAALAAQGKSEITHINYIDRGYEKLDQKLNKLGAHISRIALGT